MRRDVHRFQPRQLLGATLLEATLLASLILLDATLLLEAPRLAAHNLGRGQANALPIGH